MPTPVPLEEEEVAAVAPGAGAAAVAGPVAVVPADDADDATAGVPECTTHAGDDNGEGCAGRVGAVGAGPAAAGPASSPPPLQQAGPAPCPPDAGGSSVAAPGRRVAGPAAPPPELLAAAAAFHAEVEAAGGYGPAPDQLDDDGDDVEGLGPLAGPPPPDLLEEAEAAPADAREAAVLRVLRVLRAAAAAAAGAGGAGGGAAAAAAAALAADPYELLGVERGTDAGACRKAYWRLSLLVHPDKCVHPGAAEAFQAVSKAATLLQDAGARAAHDAAVEDAALRRRAEADAAAAMRAAEWARARGGAVPPEVAAALAAAQAAAGGPPTREDWMTQLPTGRSAASALAGLSQVSQTSFSRFGGRGRGDDDTSGWTDTPQQAAQRAAGLLTGGGGALALAAPPRRGAGEDAPVPEELRAAMAQYQAAHRQTSLLEQHQARQQQPQSARPAAPLRREQQSGDKDKDRGKSKDKDKDRDKSKHKEKSRSKDRDGGRSKDKQGTKRAAEGAAYPCAKLPCAVQHALFVWSSCVLHAHTNTMDSTLIARSPLAGLPAGPSAKVADWADKHPWQPWDRDKDLSVPVSKPKGTAELLKSAGALSSRFASGR